MEEIESRGQDWAADGEEDGRRRPSDAVEKEVEETGVQSIIRQKKSKSARHVSTERRRFAPASVTRDVMLTSQRLQAAAGSHDPRQSDPTRFQTRLTWL
ncbi:hypothetical protein LWI29_003789 [Acer saccharum]|uniref:Uncharacterized protein n=1 Tax=Acer saccharum TaxID=4024 RepID=A0AA39VXP6_ACESA|nr:hypothetical protein LWI29_003789 [Acer saccharum]